MGYFKLDKIDKIVISFTFIIVTISCILNTFSYGAIDFDVPNGYYKLQQNVFLKDYFLDRSGVLISNASANIFRVELLNGANYIYLSSPYYFTYYLSNEDINVEETLLNVSAQVAESAIYLYNNGDHKYLYLSYYEDNNVDVYTNANGMTSAISDLSRIVDIKSIWSIFENSIPYISIVVLFALGVWFIKHNIIEHSKGRDF